MLFQQLHHRRALAEADFHAQPAAGAQQRRGFADQPHENAHAERPAVEGEMGFMSDDFVRHGVQLGGGNVGRQRDHQVHLALKLGAERGEQIAGMQADALAQIEILGVGAGQVDGGLGNVGAMHLRLGYGVRKRQGEIARAATHVDHDRGRCRGLGHRTQFLRCDLAEQFAFGARNEGFGRGPQFEPHEALPSGEIGDGLPGHTALDQPVERFELRGAQRDQGRFCRSVQRHWASGGQQPEGTQGGGGRLFRLVGQDVEGLSEPTQALFERSLRVRPKGLQIGGGVCGQ